jgi:hypothetical protein
MDRNSPAVRAHGHPAVASVSTSVPEEHTSMSTTFEHFESYHAPPTNTSGSLPISPTMTAIVVDRVPVVDKEVASII